MITVQNLKKRFRTSGMIMDVNWEIPEGEIIGLFGENGAGKTTLMKCILGVTNYSGEVLLDGEKITRETIARIAYGSCEHTFFPNLTADGHKSFYMEHYPKFNEKRYEVLMDFFGLSRNTELRHMSTGQQNQVEVILALSQGADYIFLDEPFVGNDLFNREDFYKMLLGLLEEHETLVLSTHLVEEVDAFIGRAVLIKDGTIIGETTVEELEEEGTSLKEYIAKHYGYRADRVKEALEQLEE